jgi:hypothetical protein
MRKSVFYIDGGPAYIGYTNGYLWNGWATPYFTLEEAQKIQAEFNQGDGLRMFYDCQADKFILQYEDDDEPYIWEGEDIQTVDGIKHLYGIGAYSHIWDEADNDDKRYLAQTITDLMYEHDARKYFTKYDSEDSLIETVIAQFADINIFAKTHTIMNNAWNGADQVYTKLMEVLTI